MSDRKIEKIEKNGITQYGYRDDENNFVRHREDGPAVIHEDGLEQWYKDGVHHRDGGPAAYHKGIGFEWWIQNGVLHREDGPAMTYYNGESHRWYNNGRLHREDGPAIISCGKEQYHLEGAGICFPPHVILDPASQTIDEILNEENLECKRVRIERYGWERFLEEADAQVIDQRFNEVEQTNEFLAVIPGENEGDEEHMRVLVGACPSTARVYVMEVDTSITTCVEAQAYLSGKDMSRCLGAS